ncbi:hypothetical protein ACFFIX_05220 [Metabacillus herbersteinensis]|uniref:Secreted protein n=1 Tax=Metabacillus herbersteinensis TaxID=283816 RepID=A0ABV6GAY8_9BACI
MKKWVLSALIYLLVVTGGYTIYAQFSNSESVQSPTEENQHGEHQGSVETKDKEKSGHEDEGHQHDEGPSFDNDVNVDVNYQNDVITIRLADQNGNAFNDLEINHEKRLHFILVDEHLNAYYHLHPEEIATGEFQIAKELAGGSYKAFVDIKPKGLSYHVQPIQFTVGEQAGEHQHTSLEADTTLTRTVDGEKVTLEMNTPTVGKPVTLSFKLNESKLETYLGAMGHVVILDELAENFLHVHPLNDKEPIFETQFNKAGIYKIWAEFKQEGQVRVFPFVIEVKK